jgi:hypothetical protein
MSENCDEVGVPLALRTIELESGRLMQAQIRF